MKRTNTINEPIEPLDPDDIEPITCNELWSAVIARTFKDADWCPSKEKRSKMAPDVRQDFLDARASALIWLRGDTEGFRLVCEGANANPNYVKRIARSRYGRLIDQCWTPIASSPALCLSGAGSKKETEA